ncbi:unnamed protein product [Heligmosomoides polygyrus]|uniref:F-box domain-containing protein n=1 Tax=Heligmosomoides polygyrus TaxID=6339 RepID=A0A183F9H4_HELPZ|nr:unnamed protein product [Heligmosomoides polygyrus]
MWLVKRFAPQSHLGKICELLWNTSVDYGTLSTFTVCCREVLKTADLSNLFVFDKGKGWARDGWLTNSHWNAEVDFMFHIRKEADKIYYKPEDVG